LSSKLHVLETSRIAENKISTQPVLMLEASAELPRVHLGAKHFLGKVVSPERGFFHLYIFKNFQDKEGVDILKVFWHKFIHSGL
jgi:hypothetical protein